MQDKNQVYAVSAQLFTENQLEDVVLLVYSSSAELAKNKITIYQMRHQLRLKYALLPLPLELYFQRHTVADFVEPIKSIAQSLSAQNDLIIFKLKHNEQVNKRDNPCLLKTEVLLRHPDEVRGPFLYQPIPESVKPYLWQEEGSKAELDDQLKAYVIINAATSFWFPLDFEGKGLGFECLYKGEQAEIKRNIAPYLVELPANHFLAEKLFSSPNEGQEDEDGFQHWHKNFGFFFRSSADFDELVHHFRKFIILPTYDERQLYFNFFVPNVLMQYLERLTYYPEKLAAFFGGNLIYDFIVPNGDYFVHYASAIDLSAEKQAKKQFDKFEMDEVIAQQNQRLLAGLVADMTESAPFLLARYSQPQLEEIVEYHYKLCKDYQIYETTTIGLLTLRSCIYGKAIDVIDPQKKINALLNDETLTETDKIYSIDQQLKYLEQHNIIYDLFKDRKNVN